jgi:starch synthase
MPDGETPLYAIDCPALYDREGGPYQDANGHDWGDNVLRFGLLARVAAWMGTTRSTVRWRPDVVHLNDWQSGLAAALLNFDADRRARVVQSIHNIAYLGMFSPNAIPALALAPEGFRQHGYEFHGSVGFLKAGIYYADRVTTVSPRYAQEIRTPAFGAGLEGLLTELGPRLSGILNGIDNTAWDPATDAYLPKNFTDKQLAGKAVCKAAIQTELGLRVDQDTPLLAVVSRLTYQKGIDLVAPALGRIADRPFQLAILGTGERRVEDSLQGLAHSAPHRVSFVNRFDEGLAHRLEAGADIFLMPSRFEPCGLNQMYSMRYGTPPIVHGTGGLADTVIPANPDNLRAGTATGFVFEVPDAPGLAWAVERGLDLFNDNTAWRKLQRAGMRTDFGWASSAAKYVDLYEALLHDFSASDGA